MKVTFVSNYINHHQIPFCEAMYRQLGEGYHFVQTEPMEEERVRMGWGADFDVLPWLRLFYEKETECRRLIADSDVVLFGGVEEESYIAERLKQGKIVVRLSERIYKEGQWKAISPRGLLKKYHDHTRYRKAPVYLLCCGGYVASDFHLIKAYPGKMFQWGYFPEKKLYDIDELLSQKETRRKKSGKLSLLWAGRFIDWKHPEYAIRAAARLKKEGFAFSLTMVGGGAMEEELHTMVKEEGLEDAVFFAGFRKPESVREFMEQADIFLFTSDYKEGWGAVLNEAMNSGCAVVANAALGAAPVLIEPGKNGLVYPDKKFEVFLGQIKDLFRTPEKISELGRAAYKTVTEQWNAEEAAARLLPFLENLVKGEVIPQKEGILSPAFVVKPSKMYHYLIRKKGRAEAPIGGMSAPAQEKAGAGGKKRIYVCHTYYHVYISLLKEFALPREKQGKATMVLSKMSTDFENLKARLEKTGVFEEVIEFDEKRHTFFPELEELRKDRGSLLKNMIARMKYTKRYAKLQEPYVPVDFKRYEDIYVYCDSDPIGYYLNYKRIRYHAMEDGFNCLKIFDAARYDNRGCFRLKAFMASLNLIFIQNGYSKYCIDMEVNDRSCLKYDYHKYVEVPRKTLEERLTEAQKHLLIQAFMENAERLKEELSRQDGITKNAIVLTEELGSEEIRKQMFTDLIAEYCQGYRVFIKPHPKDLLDYEKVFPEHIVLKGRYPLEIMKHIPGIHFHRAVAIFTQAMETMDFVDEKLYLGADFMERYQEEGKYRYNEKI